MSLLSHKLPIAAARFSFGTILPASETRQIFRSPRLLLLVGLLLVFWCTPKYALAEQSSPGEYQVKAAFILNFAGFVEWPEESLPHKTMIIGILGDDPFDNALDALKGKTIKGRTVVVRHFDEPNEALDANIVFISASERGALHHILKTLQKRPILVIGDSRGFTHAGVMINMVIVQKRVGFEINLQAAKRAGIGINSQLLKLAKEVVEQ